MRGPASSPLPSTSAGAGMEMVKQDRDDELQERYNRSLPTRKVLVERTLTGKPPDFQILSTIINVLSVGLDDTPEMRAQTERVLRRGKPITTAHGSYRVITAHTFADWEPTPEKVTT